MGVIEPAVMVRVKQLCLRLGHPNWMPAPETWEWRRPDGSRQGFGPYWRQDPGMANLLWLAMDLHRPPAEYDASQNTLYTLLFTHGATATLWGQPLLDMAGVLPLKEFHHRLGSAPYAVHPVEMAYPLLYLLAERRLAHADA